MKEGFWAGFIMMFIISVIVVFFMFFGGNPISFTRRVMNLENATITAINLMLEDIEKLNQRKLDKLGLVTCR